MTAAGAAASLNGSVSSTDVELPHTERLAVAVIQARFCSHLPLESDAREEKKNS